MLQEFWARLGLLTSPGHVTPGHTSPAHVTHVTMSRGQHGQDFSVPVTIWGDSQASEMQVRAEIEIDISQGPDLSNELCLESERLMFVTHSYLLAITCWSTVKHFVYMHLPRCHLCGMFWDKSCSWESRSWNEHTHTAIKNKIIV